MTQFFRGMGPYIGQCIDCHRAIRRGLRCGICPALARARPTFPTWMYRCATDGELVDVADISDDGHHICQRQRDGSPRVICEGFVHLVKVQL